MRSANPGDVGAAMAWSARTQADDARRNRNRKRNGIIVEVDPEKGLARVDLAAEGATDPFISPWIPWREQAMGAMKTHFPPSVGQEVVVRSESGDLQDAEIETSLPSENNARPSQSGSEYVLAQVGSTRIVVTGQSITMISPRIDLNPGG